MRRILVFVVSLLPAFAANTVIGNFASWNGSTTTYSFGTPYGVAHDAYGQTFTVPAGYPSLSDLSFWVGWNFGDAVTFSGYLMAWDGKEATGSVLYQSSPTSVDSSTPGIAKIDFPIPNVTLTPGSQYVFFILASGGSGGAATAQFAFTSDSTSYTGGNFVFTDSGGTFSNLNNPWLQTDGDAVFQASFNSGPPSLSIAMTHSGNFSQGQIGDAFNLAVSNAGAAPTDGSTVTVADTMPTGFTATAIGGNGWTCTLASLQCTRADVLDNGSSYSPIQITLNVASNAGPSLTNSATVSGGGSATGNTSNTVAVGQISQATLTGLITARAGASNARVWTITVTNTAATIAANAEIASLTLTQTLGAACTPVIATTLPVTIGSIPASGGTASGNLTIDFSSCSGTPRFKVTAAFSANSGANGGSMTLNNQVQ